jgi:mevalonate kinase
MSTKKNLPVVDWLQIKSSAPGKFIISGEYSVVYEKQAIAATIDLRTNVTIRPNDDDVVRLKLTNLKVERAWPTSSLAPLRFVSKNSCLEYNETMPGKLVHLLHPKYWVDRSGRRSSSLQGGDDDDSEDAELSPSKILVDPKQIDDAVIAFLLLYLGIGDSFCNSARLPIDVEVDSSIPVGSGLGSSSAYSVALCGGLMKVFLASVERYIISNWAFNVDKHFHGKPSGVDNNIISVGGCILFQNGKIKAQSVAHKASIRVMLIDTCVSRSTRALGEMVASRLRSEPGEVNALFSTINEMTTLIWRKINDPDFLPRHIRDHLVANQQYLNQLGVGHEKLADICRKADQFNLTAKQTGAGGGGTAFVMYEESEDRQNVDALRDVLIESGYKVHDHSVGCEGLTVHVTQDPDKRFKLVGS